MSAMSSTVTLLDPDTKVEVDYRPAELRDGLDLPATATVQLSSAEGQLRVHLDAVVWDRVRDAIDEATS